MPGSPAYLALLDDISAAIPFQPHAEDESASWEALEEAWTRAWHVDPDPDDLFNLSKQAYRRVAALTETPIAVLLDDAADLHVRKNRGYAGHSEDAWANFRLSEKIGVTTFDGVLVRLSDKWSRIVSLRSDPANDQVGESIIDTLLDLAAYALIAICIKRENPLGIIVHGAT